MGVVLGVQGRPDVQEEVKTCRANSTMLKVDFLKDYIAQQPRVSKTSNKKTFTQKEAPLGATQELPEEVQKAQDEFVDYAFSESKEFSERLGFRATHLDVLVLFIEILKLGVRSREQEKLSRQIERETQIAHMMKVVSNFKEQGKWLLMSGVGGGALGILSGACPVIGHLWGKPIKNALGGFSLFSSMKNMNTRDFTKSMTKITGAMSEVYKQTGQIHNSYAEGSRTYDDGHKQLNETWVQERTRTLEEALQEWKSIESFLSQQLGWQHDAARSLYMN